MNTTLRKRETLASDDIVCRCKSITKSEIMEAVAVCGGDLTEISRSTGAGSVCGGCTPRIGQLAGQNTMAPAVLTSKEKIDQNHWRLTFDVNRQFGLPAADILLEVPIGGRGHARSYTVTRSSEGSLEITVRREANGIVSRWLCDLADDTHFIQISDPFGGVSIPDATRPVFLACGIGVTPALAFARAEPERRCLVHWWVRGNEAPGLMTHVRAELEKTQSTLKIHDTSNGAGRLMPGKAVDWVRAQLVPHCDTPHLCGPQGFLDTTSTALEAVGWPKDALRIASFQYTPGQGAGATQPELNRHRDFKLPQDAVRTKSFHLRAAQAPVAKMREARAFLQQFYHEVGASTPMEDRLLAVTRQLRRTGTYEHTSEELAFGARLAWRNANRCIGRFFWQSLTVRDLRGLDPSLKGYDLAHAVFAEVLQHIEFGTNGGDLRPSITVFPPDRSIFIENGQLILYAGYQRADGSIIGDPKNLGITKQAQAQGWRGAGTDFDILPVMITVDGETFSFDLPADTVAEVDIEHPEVARVRDLRLRWFALPAVANMALDLGGVVYSAAPSNGFYMGTEIGSFNLGDPKRYDRLPQMAKALGLRTDNDNPLWRDQALLELNRAVLHSFRKAGMRMLDHHDLSSWFDRFRSDETQSGRPVFGHWPWIVPPMSANLSNVWHDASLKNIILKPGYFYQTAADVTARTSGS
ncbi:MAG: nitric oxide synthase oxygenase [Pseudomonadota bacterium]